MRGQSPGHLDDLLAKRLKGWPSIRLDEWTAMRLDGWMTSWLACRPSSNPAFQQACNPGD
jgi:hypothetical protein